VKVGRQAPRIDRPRRAGDVQPRDFGGSASRCDRKSSPAASAAARFAWICSGAQ
jgi:hypothetical protein